MYWDFETESISIEKTVNLEEKKSKINENGPCFISDNDENIWINIYECSISCISSNYELITYPIDVNYIKYMAVIGSLLYVMYENNNNNKINVYKHQKEFRFIEEINLPQSDSGFIFIPNQSDFFVNISRNVLYFIK